jgi:hypothetical protein
VSCSYTLNLCFVYFAILYFLFHDDVRVVHVNQIFFMHIMMIW